MARSRPHPASNEGSSGFTSTVPHSSASTCRGKRRSRVGPSSDLKVRPSAYWRGSMLKVKSNSPDADSPRPQRNVDGLCVIRSTIPHLRAGRVGTFRRILATIADHFLDVNRRCLRAISRRQRRDQQHDRLRRRSLRTSRLDRQLETRADTARLCCIRPLKRL